MCVWGGYLEYLYVNLGILLSGMLAIWLLSQLVISLNKTLSNFSIFKILVFSQAALGTSPFYQITPWVMRIIALLECIDRYEAQTRNSQQ